MMGIRQNGNLALAMKIAPVKSTAILHSLINLNLAE